MHTIVNPHRPRDGGDVCIGESVKGGLLLLAVLISQALRAIPAMDDTAILKTGSQDSLLHHLIIGMRIDTDGVKMLQRKLQGYLENALHRSAAGNAMNSGIGGI